MIPNVPGVPALQPNLYTNDQPTPLTSDSITDLGDNPQWGIFDSSGATVIKAESLVSFEFKQDFTVADFPIEKGGFESYDKVQTPFDARCRMACGGSKAQRTAFLDSINAIIGDLNKYDVVTPEHVYQSVNFQHQGFTRRNDQGAGLIIVDLWVVEIRETAESSFSSTNVPTGPENISVTGTPSSTGNAPTSPEDIRVTAARSPSAVSAVNNGAVQTTSPAHSTQQQWATASSAAGGW